MIIERKYVTFAKLCESDPLSKDIIERVFNESYSDYKRDEIWESLKYLCLYQRDMSWAMCKIGELLDGFDKLDKSNPYDNGYTFDDVNDAEIVYKDENSVVIHLLNKYYDNLNIVKVVEIKNNK